MKVPLGTYVEMETLERLNNFVLDLKRTDSKITKAEIVDRALNKYMDEYENKTAK